MRKGKDPDPDSGSVPLTNGSGSGRPKNMRIRFRIRTGILYIINTIGILLSVYAYVRIRTSDEWIRTWEAQKHTDPVPDPDPQHWYPIQHIHTYSCVRQVSVRRALLGQKMEEESGQFLQERGERIRYRIESDLFFL
jgi:hypothetical protein